MLNVFASLRSITKPLRKHAFSHGVFSLTLGSAAAQLILLFAAPLLTRFYPPEVYGLFGVFTALLGLVAAVASLRYEIAIPLPRHDADALNLVTVSLLALACVALVVITAVILGGHQLVTLLNANALAGVLWLLPVIVVLFGATQILNYWATRRREFGMLAVSKVAHSSTVVSVQLAAGWWQFGLSGLLGGYVAGQLVALLAVGRIAWNAGLDALATQASIRGAKAMAVRYIDLPKHALWTSELNAISAHILNFVLIFSYGAAAVGLAMLAQRVVFMPVSFLANAIWQVSHAEAGRISKPELAQLLTNNHRIANKMFALPLGVLAGLSSESALLFGDEWAGLAAVIPAFAVMAFANAVSNVTSYFAALGYYRLESFVNVSLLVIKVLSVLLVVSYRDPYLAINTFAIVTAAAYLVLSLFWGKTIGRLSDFLKVLAANLFAGLVAFFVVSSATQQDLVFGIVLAGVALVVHSGLAYRRFMKTYAES